MNLRTLKKLSKRAAPLLDQLGINLEKFPAERDDSYHGAFISDRKHWERYPCHATYKGRNDWSFKRGAEIVFTTRSGRRVVMSPPSHARKGTIMVGGMSGYYEPEWSEESAWAALAQHVTEHFTDWCPNDDEEASPIVTRRLNTPSEILRAAREIVASRSNLSQNGS